MESYLRYCGGFDFNPSMCARVYTSLQCFLIVLLFQSLLCDPNPASPANSEAARLFQENKREYNRRVREIVEQSWLAAEGDDDEDDDDDDEDDEDDDE